MAYTFDLVCGDRFSMGEFRSRRDGGGYQAGTDDGAEFEFVIRHFGQSALRASENLEKESYSEYKQHALLSTKQRGDLSLSNAEYIIVIDANIRSIADRIIIDYGNKVMIVPWCLVSSIHGLKIVAGNTNPAR